MPATPRWRDRDPEAAKRLARARETLTALAGEHTVLAQNLLASDVVRRLCWRPPDPLDPDSVRAQLLELGARPWQADLTAEPLAAALLG